MFMFLDGVHFSGRKRDFYTTQYRVWAFRKCYFRLGIMTSFDDGGAFANQINALQNDKKRPMSYLKDIDR